MKEALPKKRCLACRKPLNGGFDLFSGAANFYCENEKCLRYGLVTVLVLETEGKKQK